MVKSVKATGSASPYIPLLFCENLEFLLEKFELENKSAVLLRARFLNKDSQSLENSCKKGLLGGASKDISAPNLASLFTIMKKISFANPTADQPLESLLSKCSKIV